MPEIHIEVADEIQPLGPGDWADLWADLIRAGCTCDLSSQPNPDEGSKGPVIFAIVATSYAAARLIAVLTRFYQARRQGKVVLKRGDTEWRFENMSVPEFERALEETVNALSDETTNES